eukprot:2865656-Lingulodinium_polyedra.AAC.1
MLEPEFMQSLMINTCSRPSQPRSLSATGPNAPGGALASNSFSIDATSSCVNWQLNVTSLICL